MIRMQGPGSGEGSGEVWRVWRVDMKQGGEEGETGRGATGEGETGRGQWGEGGGQRGGRRGGGQQGRGDGEGETGRGMTERGQWGRGDGEGATGVGEMGREEKEGGKPHRMPGWNEVTVFSDLCLPVQRRVPQLV